MAEEGQPPTYQTPDWEAPLYPRPPKRSLFDKLGVAKLASIGTLRSDDAALAKETLDRAPTHASSVAIGDTKPRSSFLASLRSRFDATIPPNRTYFGNSRRRFLLLFVLPIAAFFLLILPLALGLGLGLGLHKKASAQDLPLPTDTGGIFTGDLTFYSPALGACGWTSSDEDPVCAVSHLVWDKVQNGSDPNLNPLCGQQIRVMRDVEGVGNRTVDVTVVDRCVGCAAMDLDLSPMAFDQLANPDLGRVVGSWAWVQ